LKIKLFYFILMIAGLHYACEEGRVEICKLLLESGAKLDVPNREGVTPIQMAKPEVARVVTKMTGSGDF
jgi:ankyrin repeat protein